MTAEPAPEFSRPIDLDRIGDGELRREISASPEERAALARRFGLLAIGRLDARLRLRRERAGTVVRLTGTLDAEVTQSCVVTLAPVEKRVIDEFTVLYGDTPDGAAVDLDADSDDVLEPWPDGALDLGEAVAQELSLALDPYPRAEGAELEPGRSAPETPAERVNPFAGLEKLHKRPT